MQAQPSPQTQALDQWTHLEYRDIAVPTAEMNELMIDGMPALRRLVVSVEQGERWRLADLHTGLLEAAIADIASLRRLTLDEVLRGLDCWQDSLALAHGRLEEVRIGEPHLGAVSLVCPRLRVCDLECREADITLAPLLHSLAEGSPLLEMLRIRARAVLMGAGCPTAQTLADIVLAFPLLCDLNLHQTALTDGNSLPGSALDRRGDASASFPSAFAPVLGLVGMTGFRHIVAVVSDLVRRGTRLPCRYSP